MLARRAKLTKLRISGYLTSDRSENAATELVALSLKIKYLRLL